MFVSETYTEDYKYEILQLKKKLRSLINENNLLKVNNRKLQNDLDKKNKQLDDLLIPSKGAIIRKYVADRGASLILNLKQRNSELEDNLKSKENLIQKLQHELKISKAYCNNGCKKQSSLRYSRCSTESSPSTPSTASKSSRKSAHDSEYQNLNQQLQEIRLSYRGNSENDSESSVITKTDDLGKQLQNLFEEMENLKNSVSQLTTDQKNTKQLLQDKEKDWNTLSHKIKELQHTCNNELEKNIKLMKTSGDSYSDDSFESDYSDIGENINKEVKESTGSSSIPDSICSDDEDVETGNSN